MVVYYLLHKNPHENKIYLFTFLLFTHGLGGEAQIFPLFLYVVSYISIMIIILEYRTVSYSSFIYTRKEIIYEKISILTQKIKYRTIPLFSYLWFICQEMFQPSLASVSLFLSQIGYFYHQCPSN